MKVFLDFSSIQKHSRMKNVFLESRYLPCCCYAWVSGDDLKFVSWFQWTIVRGHETMSCGYNFCSWNNDPAAEWIVITISYSYSICWIVVEWFKNINLPGYFSNFDLSATKNFIQGRRYCWGNWRCHFSFIIKNIIFVSKSLCNCTTLVTSTIFPTSWWISCIAPRSVIGRLNSEDFSKIFSVLRYFIFDLFTWKQTSRNVKKCWIFSKFFRIFLNIHDFFELFKVFRIKLLSTARHKHVICIIRFAIKFHVGLFLSGRWARLGKNGFIRKTIKNWILRGLKLRRFTQNQINPH